MKKLLLSILFFLSLASYAQVQIKGNNQKFKALESQEISPNKSQFKSKRAAVETHNYYPFSIDLATGDDIVGFIQDAASNADWQNYVNFLYPDSTATIITSNGKRSVYTHLIGNSFDPRDSSVDLQNPYAPRLSKWTSYTIDTLGVRFGYHRHLDSFQGNEVVDTMIFQFFNHTQSTYTENTVSGFQSFAYPNRTNFNINTLSSSVAAKTYKLPLTRDYRTRDSITGWVTSFFEVPVGITIAPNGAKNSSFVYTMSFKPMVKTNLGDTVFYQANNASVFKKNNYVTYYFTQNEADRNSQLKQYTAFNNSFFLNANQKYNINTNGWTTFIPGNAFFEQQYVFSYYRLTTNNLAIKNTNKEVSLLNAYPNPASANSEIVLSLNSLKNTAAVVTISDISGKVINTMNTEINNGSNNITLSTNSLSNGLYIVTVKGEGFTSSSKIIIE